LAFPTITVGDMVRAERALLDVLGIPGLLAVGGGSLGGMQALEWSVAYPEAVRGCLAIATTDALDSQGVAWNAIARCAITADPAWQGGSYYGTGQAPTAGIGVARMVGHVTYLSAQSMREKFGRTLQEGDDYSYDVTGADFAVESYLRYQARSFAGRFDANSYLCLVNAMSSHDVGRDRGGAEEALAAVQARALVLGIDSDRLFPLEEQRFLARHIRNGLDGTEATVISSEYGHDGFLIEDGLVGAQLTRLLDS
jgi:homoserine O-acetyltransferase